MLLQWRVAEFGPGGYRASSPGLLSSSEQLFPVHAVWDSRIVRRGRNHKQLAGTIRGDECLFPTANRQPVLAVWRLAQLDSRLSFCPVRFRNRSYELRFV